MILIIKNPKDNPFKPHPRYAETARACRAMGMNIADDDYEKIDAMSDDEFDPSPEESLVD